MHIQMDLFNILKERSKVLSKIVLGKFLRLFVHKG